ncbi:L-ascorbate oxidase [Microthyrium microscopicum]|uniref:L-ascorbate oxidase n=1 Tax=Microthyrium microscopicum TaxID=703497 RepID=A0A6A6URI9_9PEZI|nr:L-ascorbate oxidase [Microthyrium microscopicum]
MRLLSFLAVLPLVLAAPQIHNASFTPDHVLRVTAQNISVNCESRYSVIINGTAPAPQLTLKQGEPVWIRVYNDIVDQNVTVHWHGLSQRAAPFSDGTPQVSQWPIPPAHYFDYELFPDAAGTYFYHSHVGFQAISAYGPLIVQPCGKPAHKYDEDIVFALGDYYNKTDAQVEKGLLANPFVWSGETVALLVNGQSGTSLTKGYNSTCAPHVLKVKPDTKYRIRFIGNTAISLITLGVEDHANLTIIEADGADTKPYDVSHLQVASGQRFSIILHTKTAAELASTNKTNFWIRLENRERPANVSAYALLQYDIPSASALPSTLPTTPPVTLPQIVYNWLEYALSPLDPAADPMPTKADRTVTITTHQYGTQNATTGAFTSTLEWGQNDNIWQEERVPVPYLVDVYKRGEAAVPDYDVAIKHGGWDPKNLAYAARVGEVLDIIWESNNAPTGGWDIHPFHAHGVHYWDLGSGNGTYNATANEEKLKGYDPMKRDTTMLYRYAASGVKNTTAGWRAWRIKVDEAGAFMLHCHILQHLIMGMSTAWVAGNYTDLQKIWPEPPYITGYLDYGGSAYGNETYDPIVNHYYPASSETCRP